MAPIDEPAAPGDPSKRTNLGRGLAALFGEESEDYQSLDKVRSGKSVPIEHLYPNKNQPRQAFDQDSLAALADSISASGILQPVLVRRHPERPSEFEIVAGERRWRAAQMAKLHEIPVLIRDLSDAQALELSLVENVQRQDLSPIEEAAGYHRLIEEYQHTQDALAKVIGKSRSHIANTLRLLKLPEYVRTLLMEGKLSAGHARALLGVEDPESLARLVVARGLNVRQTERLAQEWRDGPGNKTSQTKTGPAPKDPDTLGLERDLTALLGLKVTIDFAGKSGSLTIHYRTLEQLDDVLRRLNQAPDANSA